MPRENMTKEYKTNGLVGETGDKFVIRFPEGLLDKIRKQAEINRRSMNSEIVLILETFYLETQLQMVATLATGQTTADKQGVEG